MCGICGWVGGQPLPDPRARMVVEAMTAAIAHRGPDGDGAQHITGGGADGWLGHRRLRILDLSEAADQPMSGRDSKATLVFNGEIYNFRELRAELAARGHHVRSTGDTEVVLRAYEAWGPSFVRRLDGMFALAIWDERRGELLLARDRTGKKPLFYCVHAGRLSFASEIKALARMPGVVLDPDPRAFSSFLTFGYASAPDTLYRDIVALPPASLLRFAATDGDARVERWWSPPTPALARPADDSLIDAVRAAVGDAVARRTVADVPIGALLSGGIDSSVVSALMRSHAGRPVRTFSAGLADDPSFDERSHARAVAAHLGTRHTEFAVRADAAALLDRLVWLHDGPFADSSAIPTYLVCQAARDQVTVVLTGDGGDEVFAGYRRFVAAALSRLVRPDVASTALRALPLGDAGTGCHDIRRALTRFLSACAMSDENRYLQWVSVFGAATRGALLGGRDAAGATRAFDAAVRQAGGLPPIDRLIHANLLTYLPGDLHVKLDRCSMAHGLEARSPFLDTAVVELMASVRARDKIGLRHPKPILRRAFGSLVPAGVWTRPKQGFGVPMDRWFDMELGTIYAEQVLARDGLLASWLEPSALTALWSEHMAGTARNGPGLWTLLTMERWLRAIKGPHPLAEPREPVLDVASR